VALPIGSACQFLDEDEVVDGARFRDGDGAHE
jgi:hypothetical protein